MLRYLEVPKIGVPYAHVPAFSILHAHLYWWLKPKIYIYFLLMYSKGVFLLSLRLAVTTHSS